jgi:hypothetical protein
MAASSGAPGTARAFWSPRYAVMPSSAMRRPWIMKSPVSVMDRREGYLQLYTAW